MSHRAAASTPEAASCIVTDRRRENRFLLVAEVTISGDNNFYTGLSGDISEGGMFLATHHCLPVGTPVVLSFSVPTSSVPILVQGTVQWTREPRALAEQSNVFGGAISAVKPGMGVQFTSLERLARYAILAFIQKRQPEFYE